MEKCRDCLGPVGSISLLLPRAHWLLICPEDRGVFCANCMLDRAAALSEVINVTGIITFGADYDGEEETPYESLTKLVDKGKNERC